MANRSDSPSTARAVVATAGMHEIVFDAGLRSYMLSVYNYMASGVLLTGMVALLFAQSGAVVQVMRGPGSLKYIIMLAPLALVMTLSVGAHKLSVKTTQILYWAFAAVMGLSIASIFLAYTGASVATTLFATAAAFAGLSLWGYTTRRDLSAWGTFLIMGICGLIVASLISMFAGPGGLQLITSFAGVLLFAGLTAYDTQRIKSMYANVTGEGMMEKTVIMGALSLYLAFINMFMMLLGATGSRR